MVTFDELAQNRRMLGDFCARHKESVEYFNAGLSFAIYHTEIEQGKIKPADVDHLTSTVTCLESELEISHEAKTSASNSLQRAQKFATAAIDLPAAKWISDDSAQIYCRCRALPFVVQHLKDWKNEVAEHTKTIFEQMVHEPTRPAIGEAYGTDPDNWYPANAYHTFWTLRLLLELRRFRKEFRGLDNELKLRERQARLQEWARKTLAYEVSLHSAKSSALDSDQLAWSLAIVIGFSDRFQSNLAEQDFLRQAFSCLFSTQTPAGSWPHYAPLFHYKKTGNAYCYPFETFSALLGCALKPQAKFVRSALKEHCAQLIRLLDYARSTQIYLESQTPVILWSSGHRTNKPDPEGWVTASVFSYAQALRRLVGTWTREVALGALPKGPVYPSKDAAKKQLRERGRTWTADLTESLWITYINHAPKERSESVLEPDIPPIDERFARSAIFFGPPGGSKTTIVRALAGIIGWDYVELHAGHFVADGLPNVQRKAAEIFKYLMELDRAIVLFDEIDELVREREGDSDSSGRFLTTSMLPKLAELWESRKIMYFVATNHIEYFDRAITRSQRFDRIIFVSPPSFEAKIQELARLLRDEFKCSAKVDVKKADIEAAMPSNGRLCAGRTGLPLPKENALAKFALLRWDELPELAERIRTLRPEARRIGPDKFAVALAALQDGSWRSLKDYHEYIARRSYERRDFGKLNAWAIQGLSGGEEPAGVEKLGNDYILATPLTEPEDIKIPTYSVRHEFPGALRLKKLSAKRRNGRKRRRARSSREPRRPK